jgi:hypothetical protein
MYIGAVAWSLLNIPGRPVSQPRICIYRCENRGDCQAATAKCEWCGLRRFYSGRDQQSGDVRLLPLSCPFVSEELRGRCGARRPRSLLGSSPFRFWLPRSGPSTARRGLWRLIDSGEFASKSLAAVCELNTRGRVVNLLTDSWLFICRPLDVSDPLPAEPLRSKFSARARGKNFVRSCRHVHTYDL